MVDLFYTDDIYDRVTFHVKIEDDLEIDDKEIPSPLSLENVFKKLPQSFQIR